MIHRSPFLLLLRREYAEVQTPGKLFLVNKENAELCPRWPSLEARWSNNNSGCVPEGVYACAREHSPKFGMDLWELYNVPHRSECKFHWGNYFRNYDGCIGIGRGVGDVDSDGNQDITDTKNAILELLSVTEPYGKYLPLIITGPHWNWQTAPNAPSFAQAFG